MSSNVETTASSISAPSADDVNAAIRLLEATGHYRVAAKIEPLDSYGVPEEGEQIGIGFVVDTETTGLEVKADIIEFGGILFEYGMQTGCVYRVLESISCFEEPSAPIPAAVTAVNGITDEMVAGKTLDDDAINAAVKRCNFVIAHNARFDRPLLERRLPIFAKRPWGCSNRDIDWAAADITGTKLDYILFKLGFFVEGAHRALNDCQILLHALVQSRGERTFLAELLEVARRPTYDIWTRGDTFDVKDSLKGRGYEWIDDPRGRAWVGHVETEEELASEQAFLASLRGVYSRVELTTANSRYSHRSGEPVQAPQSEPMPVEQAA